VTYGGIQLEHGLPALHGALASSGKRQPRTWRPAPAQAATLAPALFAEIHRRAHAELHSRAQAWLEQVVPFYVRHQVAAAADAAAALAAATVQREGVLPWLCSCVEPAL
jgi:hypothetical protein